MQRQDDGGRSGRQHGGAGHVQLDQRDRQPAEVLGESDGRLRSSTPTSTRVAASGDRGGADGRDAHRKRDGRRRRAA